MMRNKFDNAIEYGLIISLISVAIVGLLVTFGPLISSAYESIKGVLQ